MQPSLSEGVASREASGVGILIEEITSLVDKVNAIDVRFLEVRRILVKTPFDPDDDFGQYRKKYIEFVWKSRRIAGKAGVACDDFCGDLLDLLLPNASTSKEENIQEFENAMAGWQNDGERDSQLSHDFEELSNTLKSFGIAFTERIARATDAEARLQSEIDRLDAEIARTNVSESMSRRFLLVISGAYHHARHTFQQFGIIPTLLTAVSMVISLMFAVICKSFETAAVVLKSCLRGSIDAAFRAMFSPVHEAVDKFQHLLRSLEASSGQQTSKEDIRSQTSVLEGNLRDIQLAVDKRVDILGGVSAITADVNSLSSEATSLNDIFNLLTAESVQVLAALRSDVQVVDLPAQIAALKREFSPVGKALAAYARSQRI